MGSFWVWNRRALGSVTAVQSALTYQLWASVTCLCLRGALRGNLDKKRWSWLKVRSRHQVIGNASMCCVKAPVNQLHNQNKTTALFSDVPKLLHLQLHQTRWHICLFLFFIHKYHLTVSFTTSHFLFISVHWSATQRGTVYFVQCY